MTIRRLPSGALLRVDTIDRVTFDWVIVNDAEFREAVASGRTHWDPHTGETRPGVPIERHRLALICWAQGVTTYAGADADAIHAWAAALPLITDGGAA